MPRKARDLVDEGIYHVYNRGNNKMALFREAIDYGYFLNCLREAKCKFKPEIYHYCLMLNHFHLFLQIRFEEDLARIMHIVQLKYAIYYAKKYTFVGHVFQERYRSPRIQADSYYLQCGRYIERNPVKARIVDHAEDYPYSSAVYYVFGRPDDLITPNVYYQAMGATPEPRQRNYQAFLSMEEPYTALLDRAVLID
jgi:putative transposase